MKGIWLGIDASTADLALGVWWEGGGAQRNERLERRLASGLVPALEALLAEVGVSPREIRGVAVGEGPGSVTGVRIARAFGSGLARACGVDVAGGDSLAARAVAHLPPGGSGEVATFGRRDRAWVRAFVRDGDRGLTSAGAATERPLAALAPEVAASLRVPPDAVWLAWRAAHATEWR